VFYPLEEGRKSKGKNSLWDWVRNKDHVACENAPLSDFFYMICWDFASPLFEKEMGAALGPSVFRGLIWWKPQGRAFVWENHTCV